MDGWMKERVVGGAGVFAGVFGPWSSFQSDELKKKNLFLLFLILSGMQSVLGRAQVFLSYRCHF